MTSIRFRGRAACGRCRPSRENYPQRTPADTRPDAEAFQCTLRFDAAGYGIFFDNAGLQRPLPTSNPMLAEMHERLLGEGLERLRARKGAAHPAAASNRHRGFARSLCTTRPPQPTERFWPVETLVNCSAAPPSVIAQSALESAVPAGTTRPAFLAAGILASGPYNR